MEFFAFLSTAYSTRITENQGNLKGNLFGSHLAIMYGVIVPPVFFFPRS